MKITYTEVIYLLANQALWAVICYWHYRRGKQEERRRVQPFRFQPRQPLVSAIFDRELTKEEIEKLTDFYMGERKNDQ